MGKSLKKTGRPKATKGVGVFIKQLLMKPLSYAQIAGKVEKKFPDSKIEINYIRWYAWKMRQEKIKLPPRLNSSYSR